MAHAVNATLSLDSQGRIICWSPAAEALFGYSQAESQGRLFTELLIPEAAAFSEEPGREPQLSGSIQHDQRLLTRPIEMLAMNKQGEPFPVIVSLYKSDDGKGSEFIAVIRPKLTPLEQQKRIAREIKDTVHGKWNLDEILNLAVRRLGEFMKADRCVIWLYDPKTESFLPPRHEYVGSPDIPSVNSIALGERPFLSNTLSRKEAFYIPDLEAIPDLPADDRELMDIRSVRSLLHIPLSYQGRFYGFLRFHSIRAICPWDENMVDFAQEVGLSLSQAIDEADRETLATLELEERIQQREMLALLSQRALTRMAIQPFLELVASRLTLTMGLEFCRILQKPAAEAVDFKVHATVSRLAAESIAPVSDGLVQDALAAYAVDASQPVISRNLREETRFQAPDWLLRAGANSVASVLIYTTKGVFGVLEVASLKPRVFSDSDITFLQTVSNILGIAMERDAAEKEAEEKNSRYEMLLDTASYAVWDWNLETGAVGWNENTYTLLGLSPDTFVPTLEAAMALVHPEDRPELDRLMAQTIKSGGSVDMEFRMRHSDGHYIHLFTQFTVIRDEAGQSPVHLVGMSLDISHRKQQELRLRESEERFRILADEVPVLIWMADSERNVSHANRSFREFFGTGTRLEDLLGLRLEKRVKPEQLPEVIRIYESAVRERKPYMLECQVKRQDGEYRWLLFRGVPRLLPNGDFLGFIGIAMDITERKLIELQLQESEARFRNMADAAPALIGQVDREGRSVYMNQACVEFANASMEELLGDGWIRVIHPADRERLIETYRAYIPRRVKFSFEYRAIRHDGAIRHILNTAAPRFNADGEFVGYMVIGTDITEQREAMLRFQRLSDSNIIGLAQWRADGQVVDANDAFLDIIGYTRQDVETGHLNALAITPQEYLEAEGSVRQELAEHGVCAPYEKQYTHRDGHRVDILIGEATLEDRDDEDVAFIVDISARKETERALQAILERERLRHRLMELATRTIEMKTLFNTIATEIGQYYRVDRCLLVSYEPHPEHPERLRPADIGQYRASRQLPPAHLEDWPDTVLKRGVSIEETLSSINTSDLASAISYQGVRAEGDVCPMEGSPDYLHSIGSVLVEKFGVQSCLRIGVRFRELGYGCIALMQSSGQRVWTPDEVALLQDLSYQVGSILYQAKLHEQEQQAKRDLEANLKREQVRRRILQISSESWDMSHTAQVITEEVGRFLGADRCCIFQYQPTEEGAAPEMKVTGQYLSGPDIKPIDFESFPKELLTPLTADLTESSAVKLCWMPTRESFLKFVDDRMREKGIADDTRESYRNWVTSALFDEYGSKSVLRIDIVHRGRVYGALALHFCREHRIWQESESDVLYDLVYHIGSVFSQAELHENEQRAKQELEQSYNLIHIVSEAQAHFISNEDPVQLFRDAVNKLLAHTNSQFGLIGDIWFDSQGKPYLKMRFLTNIAWDEMSRNLYRQWEEESRKPYVENARIGLEFHNMNNLLGRVILTGQPVISNDPLNDPRSGGLPPGHPPLTAFMGLPLYKGNQMVGMVGIANRPGGYTMEMAESLQPYMLACANIICGLKAEQERTRLTQELKRSEQSLKTYANRLEKSNKELEQFATIASHDLQAPLRKVVMFSDFIKTTAGENLPADCYDYIERIQKSVLKMQALISDLLVLSRVTRKGKPFDPVDLGDVIQEVLSDLEAYCRDNNGTVEIQEAMTIDADATQMHQVFQNLIGNALKFHEKGVPPVVRVSARPVDENTCEIRVQDEGIGFDEKYLDRIFAVFERLHGEHAYEGTGMGLAIVQKIAERHGGSVTAESQPGHGATFIVRLPIRH